MGLIKENGNAEQINLKYYGVKNLDAEYVAEAIKSPNYKKIKNFKISHNRLNNVGAKMILESLQLDSQEIDLSYNHIGL